MKAAIGISAHLGWAATATIAIAGGDLRVLRSDRVATAPEDDREVLEPFHVAGGFDGLSRVPRPKNPERVLARGLAKQRSFTLREVRKLERALSKDGFAISAGGVLQSRGRAAATFEKQIGSHTQIHVEEGLAVRAAFAAALEAIGAQVVELDTKDLMNVATERIGRSEAALTKALAQTKPENGGAWRKEEKHAAIAAWIALLTRR